MGVRSYVCPGEAHEISRSIHLARLAADYCKCAACPHRDDLGGIALPPRPARVETPLQPVLQRERLWRSLRLPGAKRELLEHCEALAALLWEEIPRELAVNDWEQGETAPPGPLVCVGAGESEIAQSFVADVIRVLRRCGCRVASIGSVTRPMLDFAIDHLECEIGIWVEGGESPAGLGIRVVSAGGRSWSARGGLERIAKRVERGAARPSRSSGGLTSYDIRGAYREGLLRHLVVTPGSELVVAGMTDMMQEVWQDVDAKVNCVLQFAEAESASQGPPSAPVVRGLQERVVRGRLQGGVLFGPDGRQTWIIDRKEGLLTDRQVAEQLAIELKRESGGRDVRVMATEDLMWTSLSVAGTRLLTCGPTEEELVLAMQRHQAVLGCDGSGRFWIGRTVPRCDGLLTLGYASRWLGGEVSVLGKLAG